MRAQKAAISEQLAQAKRNFEVGTATITDTHEAQARYDLIVAQEIAAQNDLESKRRALQLLTGKEYGRAQAAARATSGSTPPNPNDMQTWVEHRREAELPGADRQEAASEVAALEAKRNSAGAPADARLRRHPRPDRPERHGRQPRPAATSRRP